MEVQDLFHSLKVWSDIEGLVENEIRESDTLEYKAAERKFEPGAKNEIAKDVSAMANSSGGILIYGVDCDKGDKTKPVGISGVVEENIETFDRVVNSQIKRDIKGIQKRVIENSGNKVMVVLVPQSEESPHQSLYDHKYYRRSLSESLPMEHDIVELHFGRRLGPLLDLVTLNVDKKDLAKLSFKEDGFSEPVRIRLMIYNSGKRVGKYVESILLFPASSKMKLKDAGGLENIDDLYAEVGFQARQFAQSIGVFHPFMRKKIADLTIELSKDWLDGRNGETTLVDWTIFADEMMPRSGRSTIANTG